ncbi:MULTISPECIES: hypothetical protein [Pseudomonas]|uniref:hypothetical protein n=1 Tax=Pseudomonas TaxID=286 RepID=UPI001BEBF15D|nr:MULTISPECIES: hypothetical protein [Pseudomonas]MBT2340315.1 hypothetical protein [Pseudomonas fluorescens]MCD4530323.1 hypothetical protein [Pseudomonas sp. C3-2018]
MSLSQDRVDYGRLHRGELLVEQPGETALALGKRTLNLNVVCPQPTAMALRFDSPGAGPEAFSLGLQGSFTLDLKRPRLDGQAVELFQGRARSLEQSSRMLPGQTLVARRGGAPIQGRMFSAQVEIETYLPASATRVRDETLIDGRGRFELVPHH